jgi:dienelactone hydrolase
LIGHSLGGSVALAAASEVDVTGVVALAPWLGGSESTSQLGDVATLIVHGNEDRITSYRASQKYSERARHDDASISFVEVERGGHAMLRRMTIFDALAARYTRAVLDPGPPRRRPSGRQSQLDRLIGLALATPTDYRI